MSLKFLQGISKVLGERFDLRFVGGGTGQGGSGECSFDFLKIKNNHTLLRVMEFYLEHIALFKAGENSTSLYLTLSTFSE